MSVITFAILNAVLATLVVAAIVGGLIWGVLTQHRDPGCEQLRLVLGRRSRTPSPRPLPLGVPEFEPPAEELVLG